MKDKKSLIIILIFAAILAITLFIGNRKDKLSDSLTEDLVGTYESIDKIDGKKLQFNFYDNNFEVFFNKNLLDKGSFIEDKLSEDVYIYTGEIFNGYIELIDNTFYFYIPKENDLDLKEGVYLVEKLSDTDTTKNNDHSTTDVITETNK